ncbi:MAG TPA: hypothetical protein PKE41_09200 [Candidatus Macondimonas sp.]|nr:hypothetical protein [Candidatus Macondimonas sp.]
MTSPKELDVTHACQVASGDPVRDAFSRLGPVVDFSSVLAADDPRDLAKCLAAEQIAHLVEGWRYCAAAFHASLVNATDNAQHFAYYAELRAAMSLFSGSGIRVNRHNPFFLDARRQQHSLKKQPTHTIVWAFWPLWAQRADALDLLKRKITLVPGVTIDDVETSLIGLGASQCLQGWGYDLLQLENDHNARNIASYEAFWATRPLTHMEQGELNLLSDLWTLLLPEDGARLRFDIELICYLVRRALSTLKLSRSNHDPEDGETAGSPTEMLTHEDADLQQIVSAVAAQTGANEGHLMRVLTSGSIVTPFTRAEEKSSEVANMLCRAVFLLRLATLSVNERLPQPGSAAKSWIANWLEYAGLGDKESDVEFADFSEDWRLALEDFSPQAPLPLTLWNEQNARRSTLLSRPDACLAWGVLA